MNERRNLEVDALAYRCSNSISSSCCLVVVACRRRMYKTSTRGLRLCFAAENYQLGKWSLILHVNSDLLDHDFSREYYRFPFRPSFLFLSKSVKASI